MTPFGAVAYTIDGAAAVTPLGRDRIREAIDKGDLVAHYHPDSNATLILAGDLVNWIASLPTTRPKRLP